MSGTMIDTNVMIDVLDSESAWHDWCADAVVLAMSRGPVCINPIVFAELSVSFDEPADVDAAIDADIERRGLPWNAAFLAGKAHQRYRHRGGSKMSPLPASSSVPTQRSKGSTSSPAIRVDSRPTIRPSG